MWFLLLVSLFIKIDIIWSIILLILRIWIWATGKWEYVKNVS